MTSAGDLLRVDGLHKRFSAPVLVDFGFDVSHGEVHALVGSNGAGKSTFARILSGLVARDGGTVVLEGRPCHPDSRRAAEHAGVLMVAQELTLIGTLSVAENMFLSRLPRRGGFIRFDEMRASAQRSLARVGLGALDPRTPAGALGVGQQHLVEIAAALSRRCRLLILDEPTAALSDAEVEQLFANIRRLKGEGIGVIYISHRMDEIRRIADRVTVMRDGRSVATHAAAGTTPADLVREMVGHDLPPRKPAAERSAGEVALHVRELRAGAAVRDVTLEARRGESLGSAGLVGAGRTETLRAIFGADARDSGAILVDGRSVSIRSPAHAVALGIGLVPEDRQHDALLLPQSIRVNTTLSTVPRHARRGGWIERAAETRTTESQCRRLQVRCTSYEQPVGELSGGNQQKVAIARWLARDCRVLLFDEPTRGIDVAAKDTIYELLRDLAAQGKAIVVVSSDLVELMALCDRLLVMSLGRIVAEFRPPAWTQEAITRAAFAGHVGGRTGGGA